jgi:hypothetical protein
VPIRGRGGASAVFTFPGYGNGAVTSVLPEGNYYCVLADPSQPPGQDVIGRRDFFVLAADANRDRVVDLTDFTILAASFNSQGKRFSEGNFNYDLAGNVDLTDFTILAASFNHGLDYPPEGVQLAATIDTTDPLDYQARLWWSPVANAATYTLDFSIDGASNFDTVDTQSTDYAAYLDGFDTMVPGECNYIRVNALDSTGATIARSNFVKLILPEGQQAARPSDNTGPAATQQMPTTQSVSEIVARAQRRVSANG